MLGLKGYLIAACLLIALIASCSIVRNCRKFWNPRPPRPPHSETLTVIRATTGASLECAAGRKDKRTRLVILADIAAPAAGEPFAEVSRANLERIAGKTIRVESERRGLFRSEDVVLLQQVDDQGKVIKEEYVRLDCKEATATAEAPEECPTCGGAKMIPGPENPPSEQVCPDCEGAGIVARGPIVGVVFGDSGSCLNLEQIMSSMAKCLPNAPKEWKSQEAIAKKKKLGVWHE